VPLIGGSCKYCGKCPGGEVEAGRTTGDGQEKEDVKLRLKVGINSAKRLRTKDDAERHLEEANKSRREGRGRPSIRGHNACGIRGIRGILRYS
jgi:hypothetical protein